MNKENMLKPCPLCASTEVTEYHRMNPSHCVGCDECDCSAPFERWQSRTILPDVTEEWQPIETAPDDRWVLVAEAPYEPGPYDAYAAHRHPDGYWMANCGQPVVQSPEPTHWRPLPEPPTIAKDAG